MTGVLTPPNIVLPRVKSIPGGFVLGRIAGGIGPVQLIPLAGFAWKQIMTALIQQAGAKATYVTWLGMMISGAGSAILGVQYAYGAVAPVTAKFPSTTAAGTYAVCDIAPLANYVIYVINNLAQYKNAGATGSPNGIIATITFAANSTTGTIAWATGQPFTITAGEYLYFLTSPTSKDATITGINILLVGDYVSG